MIGQRLAKSLIDLLKKDRPWNWEEDQKRDFKKLKASISSEPVLKLSDFDVTFEVHTNASDKAVGGVLVLEGHPVAFES